MQPMLALVRASRTSWRCAAWLQRRIDREEARQRTLREQERQRTAGQEAQREDAAAASVDTKDA